MFDLLGKSFMNTAMKHAFFFLLLRRLHFISMFMFHVNCLLDIVIFCIEKRIFARYLRQFLAHKIIAMSTAFDSKNIIVHISKSHF